VAAVHKLAIPANGDFLVDDKYLFEIGGKDKTARQLSGTANSYVVRDDVDYPVMVLPLWVFGFLY